MVIRKATTEDITALNDLFWDLDTDAISSQAEHFQREERTIEYFLEIINSNASDFLIAVVDDDVVGFLLVFEREINGLNLLVPCKYAYIHNLVVKEKYRNKGIGSQLMDESKKWAKEHGMDFVKLSVLPNNKRARRFCERHGFSEQMAIMECSVQ